jgi:predicted nucleotidyltransferase
MDMYKVKWTQLESSILRFLCIKAGSSFNVRAIAKELNVSPTAISNSVKNLEKENTIKITKSKIINLHLIELNRENPIAIEFKRIENLKLIYESELNYFLGENFPGCTILLFGSYSRGEDIWSEEVEKHTSDIDIAIIGSKRKELNIEKFNKLLERKITLNFYPSWKEIHKDLKENILRGIILKGDITLT